VPTPAETTPLPLVDQAEIDPAEDARRRAAFPLGAALGFADLEDAGREPVLDLLRGSEPVSWVPALGGWLVTSRDAARQVLLPRSGATVQVTQNLVRASLGTMMLTTDAEEHDRRRSPFEAPFRAREAGSLFAAPIQDECTRLIGSLRERGECELGHEFAAPFAVSMAARVLGLSLEDTELVDGFYSAFAGAMVYDGDTAPQALADRARSDLDAILHAELARVREHADSSITSVVARDPGTTLTDEEIVAQLRVIMFGSIETIQASVMNTVLLLLQHPDQLADVLADPGLVDGAVEESLRLVPPVAFAERWTRDPLCVGGVELGTGEFVGVSILAANRDPATFADPTSYDVRRGNARKALSFSFGEHHCLGVHLARLQTTTAVRRILDELPGLRLVDHVPPAGFAFRRPASLRIAWDG
jgi:cytochrome P450